MSEHDNKAKCALVQLFAIDKEGKIEVGEDGSQKKLSEAYAFFGDLENVDYGTYGDFNNGDGYLQLVTVDGKSLTWHSELVESFGISGAKWNELVSYSGVKIEAGRFVEWAQDSCNDGVPCIVRVSGMANVPEISAEDTIKLSDLSDAQKHEIKINGKPLFGNGDVTSGGCVMLCERLSSMVDGIWTSFIERRLSEKGVNASGLNIHVVEEPSADSRLTSIEIKAPQKLLYMVLETLGCNDPSKVRILHSEGLVDGDRMENTVHFVRLLMTDRLTD